MSVKTYGVSSMVAPLQRVALHAPGKTLRNADAHQWHYGDSFDPKELGKDYQKFVSHIEQAGVEVLWMPENTESADAVFTYDASLMTPQGAILMNPGKVLRASESESHRLFYQSMNIPVIGQVMGEATCEAGDTLWLDDQTLLIGRGYRTNEAGIIQMQNMLGNQGVTVLAFDLPCYKGEQACLHLMSLISLLAEDLALVHKALLPVALAQLLRSRGFELLEAPVDEFEASGGLNLNVLTLAPRHVVAIDGCDKTLSLMRNAGCKIDTFSGESLCIPCEGGPTCMTRPILRASNKQKAQY